MTEQQEAFIAAVREDLNKPSVFERAGFDSGYRPNSEEIQDLTRTTIAELQAALPLGEEREALLTRVRQASDEALHFLQKPQPEQQLHRPETSPNTDADVAGSGRAPSKRKRWGGIALLWCTIIVLGIGRQLFLAAPGQNDGARKHDGDGANKKDDGTKKNAEANLVDGGTKQVDTTPRTVDVPDVVGQELSSAKTLLAEKEFRLTVEGEEYQESIPAGSVYRLEPEAGSKVAIGSEIKVWISKGPRTVAATPKPQQAPAETSGQQLAPKQQRISDDLKKFLGNLKTAEYIEVKCPNHDLSLQIEITDKNLDMSPAKSTYSGWTQGSADGFIDGGSAKLTRFYRNDGLYPSDAVFEITKDNKIVCSLTLYEDKDYSSRLDIPSVEKKYEFTGSIDSRGVSGKMRRRVNAQQEWEEIGDASINLN